MPTFNSLCSISLALGILLVGTLPAGACGNGRIILEDKFETLDPAWDFAPNAAYRTNGPAGLTYRVEPGQDYLLLNQAGIYENYEVCAVFDSKLPSNEANVWMGVAFWAEDRETMYEADVYPAWGSYTVMRYLKGKTLKPVPLNTSPTIHKGTESNNELSVVVEGSKSTFRINGTKIVEFRGQPPEHGSLFGFAIGSLKSDKGPSTVTLKRIELREVAAVQPGETVTQPHPSSEVVPATPSVAPSAEGTSPQQIAPAPSAPSATPPTASASSEIEGVKTALGAPRESVVQAYPNAVPIGTSDLSVPAEGLKLFFTKDGKLLREIMLEAPYAGSVGGVRIGDKVETVEARKGRPSSTMPVFGGTGHVYHLAGNILRYDIDAKSNAVSEIILMLDQK